MVSVITNTSALLAVRTLSDISSQMNSTMKRISTGMKVADAFDDGAAFAVAQSLRSDIGVTRTVNEMLGVNKALLGVMGTAGRFISDELNELKKTMVEAQGITADPAVYQQKIDAILKNIDGFAANATVNGINLLVDVPGGKVRDNSLQMIANKDIQTIDIGKQPMQAADLGLSGLTPSDPNWMEKVDAAISNVNSKLATIGFTENRVQNRATFNSKVADNMEMALSAIVDADVPKELAKLEQLKVRQEIAAKMLSISNQNLRDIISSLFR